MTLGSGGESNKFAAVSGIAQAQTLLRERGSYLNKLRKYS